MEKENIGKKYKFVLKSQMILTLFGIGLAFAFFGRTIMSRPNILELLNSVIYLM